MEIYLVGGAVRDTLLKLPVKEHDWVVVGATVDDMLEQGYQQVGKDFPVFLHPKTKDEYALARTERKSGHGYKGFVVHAAADITLEEDLKRRDLTINAIAQNNAGELIDPFNGQEDLNNGLLRHISPAFSEDPVRILRVARFAARFSHYGFKVAHSTNTLMRSMVTHGEIDYLVPERVWRELEKALLTESPHIFFKVLRGCHALKILFPEIDRSYPENSEAHGAPLTNPALTALQHAATVSTDPRIRFAVLLLSLAIDDKIERRKNLADTLCARFKIPNEYRELATRAILLTHLVNSRNPEHIIEFLEQSHAYKDDRRWQLLLDVFITSGNLEKTHRTLLKKLRDATKDVNAQEMLSAGLSGPQIGQAIRDKRLALINAHL